MIKVTNYFIKYLTNILQNMEPNILPNILPNWRFTEIKTLLSACTYLFDAFMNCNVYGTSIFWQIWTLLKF